MSMQPWLDALASKDFVQETFRRVLADHDGQIPGIVDNSLAPKRTQLELEHQSLQQAAVFSFSGFAQQAIAQAAPGVPLDYVLTNDTTPNGGSNWWWFDEPLDITHDGEPIVAMLWSYCVYFSRGDLERATVMPDDIESALNGEKMVKLTWESDDEEPKFQLRMSVFVKSKDSGLVLPAAGWIWDSKVSIAEQLKETIKTYPSAGGRREIENTCETMRQTCQFFVAAQTWMEQEILEAKPVRIKKTVAGASRSERKHAPSQELQIVQLRKKHIVDDERHASQTDREWQHQWVVNGHWRHQAHGVGRAQRKLIYINSFVKGPDDKPFKPTARKVYAVLR